MGFFDFLKPKPQRCTGCQAETRLASALYSGLSDGEQIALFCPRCLLKELSQACHGKTLLFVEPLTIDAYTFTPGDSPAINPLAQERLQMALKHLNSSCAECSKSAEYLWMPQSDLDQESMGRLPEGEYVSIASMPQDWRETNAYCSNHLVKQLEQYMEKEKSGFLNFRMPNQALTGYFD